MQKLLLCPPEHYGIEYEINPWMSRARGADKPLVQAQWKGLFDTLSIFVERLGKPNRAAIGQRTKAGVDVIKARIDQLD